MGLVVYSRLADVSSGVACVVALCEPGVDRASVCVVSLQSTPHGGCPVWFYHRARYARYLHRYIFFLFYISTLLSHMRAMGVLFNENWFF